MNVFTICLLLTGLLLAFHPVVGAGDQTGNGNH